MNGIYTIQNSSTGEHRTFKISRQKDDARFAPGKLILSVLEGPDNTMDYKGFAFVDDEKVVVWRSCRGVDPKMSKYDWYAVMIQTAIAKYEITDGEGGEIATSFMMKNREYDVLWSKRCRRCNRTLTDPESIKSGIGPECAKREGE